MVRSLPLHAGLKFAENPWQVEFSTSYTFRSSTQKWNSMQLRMTLMEIPSQECARPTLMQWGLLSEIRSQIWCLIPQGSFVKDMVRFPFQPFISIPSIWDAHTQYPTADITCKNIAQVRPYGTEISGAAGNLEDCELECWNYGDSLSDMCTFSKSLSQLDDK